MSSWLERQASVIFPPIWEYGIRSRSGSATNAGHVLPIAPCSPHCSDRGLTSNGQYLHLPSEGFLGPWSPLCPPMWPAKESWGIKDPCTHSHPKTGGNWCINTPVPSPLGWMTLSVIHIGSRVPSGTKGHSQGKLVCLITHPLLISFPPVILPHFPIMFPGVTI